MLGAGSGVSGREYFTPAGKMAPQRTCVLIVNVNDAGFAKTAFLGNQKTLAFFLSLTFLLFPRVRIQSFLLR